MTRTLALLAALCGLLALAPAGAQTAAAAGAASAPAPVDDSLFVALGGHAGIERIVDELVPRLATSPHTRDFFKHVDQPHLELMLAQKFCELSGGGCAYTGRSMVETHHEMDISRGDFNAVVEVLQQAMEAQGVPFATQNRLLAKLAPLHREIVTLP